MVQSNREFRNFKIFYGLFWGILCLLSPIISLYSIIYFPFPFGVTIIISILTPLIILIIYYFRIEKEIRKKFNKIMIKFWYNILIIVLVNLSLAMPTFIIMFIEGFFRLFNDFIIFLVLLIFYLIISPFIILYLIKLLKLRLSDEFLNEESNN
jgi:hypothetical protein